MNRSCGDCRCHRNREWVFLDSQDAPETARSRIKAKGNGTYVLYKVVSRAGIHMKEETGSRKQLSGLLATAPPEVLIREWGGATSWSWTLHRPVTGYRLRVYVAYLALKQRCVRIPKRFNAPITITLMLAKEANNSREAVLGIL